MGRDTLRLHYAKGGSLGHRAGDHRFLSRMLGALQSAEDRHFSPVAEDFYGKATKITAARECPRATPPGLHGKTLTAFDFHVRVGWRAAGQASRFPGSCCPIALLSNFKRQSHRVAANFLPASRAAGSPGIATRYRSFRTAH